MFSRVVRGRSAEHGCRERRERRIVVQDLAERLVHVVKQASEIDNGGATIDPDRLAVDLDLPRVARRASHREGFPLGAGVGGGEEAHGQAGRLAVGVRQIAIASQGVVEKSGSVGTLERLDPRNGHDPRALIEAVELLAERLGPFLPLVGELGRGVVGQRWKTRENRDRGESGGGAFDHRHERWSGLKHRAFLIAGPPPGGQQPNRRAASNKLNQPNEKRISALWASLGDAPR